MDAYTNYPASAGWSQRFGRELPHMQAILLNFWLRIVDSDHHRHVSLAAADWCNSTESQFGICTCWQIQVSLVWWFLLMSFVVPWIRWTTWPSPWATHIQAKHRAVATCLCSYIHGDPLSMNYLERAYYCNTTGTEQNCVLSSLRATETGENRIPDHWESIWIPDHWQSISQCSTQCKLGKLDEKYTRTRIYTQCLSEYHECIVAQNFGSPRSIRGG